mgnify:CR=1 FL=1
MGWRQRAIQPFSRLKAHGGFHFSIRPCSWLNLREDMTNNGLALAAPKDLPGLHPEFRPAALATRRPSPTTGTRAIYAVIFVGALLAATVYASAGRFVNRNRPSLSVEVTRSTPVNAPIATTVATRSGFVWLAAIVLAETQLAPLLGWPSWGQYVIGANNQTFATVLAVPLSILLGLGSNIGDRLGYLRRALERLEKQGVFTTGILLEVSETPTRRQYLADHVGASINDVATWRDESLMLNLAAFGPLEHQLFVQAGIEGLHDLLTIELAPFATRLKRAARDLAIEAPDDLTIETWWEQARTLEDE